MPEKSAPIAVPPVSDRERLAQREAWVRTRLRESFNLVTLLEVVWEAHRLVSDGKASGPEHRLVSADGLRALGEALVRMEKK